MKAISKKLLSLLVVIAMVLSMVPFGGLSIFAVETKAVTEESADIEETSVLTDEVQALIAKGKQVKEDAEKMQTDSVLTTGSIEAVCPVCGETVTWEDLNAAIEAKGNGTAFSAFTLNNKHYYLSEDLTCTTTNATAALSGAYSGKVGTLHLNGKNITSAIAVYTGGGGTTNIIGSGTVTTTNTGVASTYAYGTIWMNISKGTSVLNLYGGTFTKGTSVTTRAVANISDNGGTINLYEGATIDGANVATTTASRAGSVHLAGKGLGTSTNSGDAVLNIYGGTIQNGDADATNKGEGGNVNLTTAYSSLNMYAGSVSGGSAYNGGNIAVASGATLYIGEGATIYGGTATSYGGNVYTNSTVAVETAGTIYGGKAAAGGGNINVAAGRLVKVTGGKIYGGNVTGTAGSNWGGNIRAYNASVEISGGMIYGGTGGGQVNGANVMVAGGFGSSITANLEAKLEISGGTIVGNIQGPANAASTKAGTSDTTATFTYTPSVILSGAPTIVTNMTIDGVEYTADRGLSVSANCPADISGLTGGDIAVTQGTLGAIISKTSTNASSVVDYFSNTNATLDIGVNDNDQLYVIEKEPEVGVFDPESFEGQAYCPVCGTLETWNDFNSYAYTNVKGHYYLSDDLTKSAANQPVYVGSGTGCFNLNGYTLSIDGRIAVTMADTTLNVMDTSEGKTGTVESTGTQKSSNALYGHTVVAQGGGSIVLYGGTFKNTDSEAGNVVLVNNASSSITIKDGAVIDAAGAKYGVNVALGSFVMDGGQINGGSTNTACVTVASGKSFTMNGGTIDGKRLVQSVNTSGTFTMNSGTIQNGIATNGGNVYVASGANFVMNSGYIKEGTAQRSGGNIHVSSDGSLTIKGGEIHNGTAAVESANYGGGNIYSDGKVTMSGGTVHTGTAALGPGGNVLVNGADMEMSGDAKIYSGTATAHQAGNVRVYKGKLTMSGEAGIYGGHSGSSSKTHNVWIVAGDMEMSGNSYVYGKDQTNANAISIAPYGGTSATLTLKDNAKVMNDPKTAVVSKGSINLGYTANNNDALTDDMHANIVIDNSWTGEAYIMMNKSTGALNAAGTATAMAWLSIGDTVDGGEGSVNGPVGTGTSFTGNLYYTARTYYTGIIGSDSGKLVLAGHAVVDTETDTEQWMSMADAVTAAAGSTTKYLKAAASVELNGETVYIDALSAITVTGTGTAYGIDIANGEDYANASTGSFSGIVQSDATFNEVRYIKIDDGTVHAIKMRVTGVSLRPTAVGLYYKATYECDETLAKAITAYGVVLSVEDMPGVDFTETPTDQFTVREDFSDLYAASTVANTVTANSGSVFGIMKDGKDNNQERGEMKIYANAYILVNGEAIYVGDTENADKDVDTEGFDGVALSLYDVLKKIDDQVTAGKLELSQTNIEQITELYSKIKAWGVSWTSDNIQ